MCALIQRDPSLVELQKNFLKMIPLLLPFVAPQGFTLWFLRFYTFKTSLQFFLWAQRVYSEHYALFYSMSSALPTSVTPSLLHIGTALASKTAKMTWRGIKFGAKSAYRLTDTAIRRYYNLPS